MEEGITVYGKISRQYLDEIFCSDYSTKLLKLGVRAEGNGLIVPFFGKPYRLAANGIFDPSGMQPTHSVSVVLCKYLLLCPDIRPAGDDWVSYRDFKDAAPFAGAFANNVEKAIARNFTGKLTELQGACLKLGGYPPEVSLSYQLSLQFDALPKVPILLLFNDRDSEFPAKCSVLFERRAYKYLDPESLAIVGWVFTDYLKKDLILPGVSSERSEADQAPSIR
jgi:hypothetical protein